MSNTTKIFSCYADCMKLVVINYEEMMGGRGVIKLNSKDLTFGKQLLVMFYLPWKW